MLELIRDNPWLKKSFWFLRFFSVFSVLSVAKKVFLCALCAFAVKNLFCSISSVSFPVRPVVEIDFVVCDYCLSLCLRAFVVKKSLSLHFLMLELIRDNPWFDSVVLLFRVIRG
jgi:hypothetical protein